MFLTRTRAAWKSKRNMNWEPRFGICWASCMQLSPAPGLTWSGQSITSQEFGELPRQGKLVTESQSGAACHMKVTSSLELISNSCLLNGVSDACGQSPKQGEEVRRQGHSDTLPKTHNHTHTHENSNTPPALA